MVLRDKLPYHDARPPANQVVHGIPDMPVVINGERHEPEIVLEYENEPLHMVYDKDAANGEVIRIYKTKKEAKERIKNLYEGEDTLWNKPQETTDEFSTDGGISRPTGSLNMYEHVDLGGCEWTIGGSPLSVADYKMGEDFTKLMSCGFVFWGWKSANDRISSMDWKFTHSDGLTFYEHIERRGSSFTVPAMENGLGMRENNLHRFGWGDRISSVDIAGRMLFV